MPEVKFRWAVGEPDGPQAPPWTLTVRGSEFVLAVRTPRQRWHVTFHASGLRHWRFDSPATLARSGGPSAGPDADTWQAPDPADGVVTEFVEITPTSELRPPRSRRQTDKVQWISPAPPDEAVRVVLVRCRPGTPATGALWSTPLASGETLAVIVVVGPISGDEGALLARARAALATHAADAKALADAAGFEWGRAGDRSRFWMTVGVD